MTCYISTDIDATVGRLQLREVGRQEGKDKDGESELVDFHETSAHSTSESEGTYSVYSGTPLNPDNGADPTLETISYTWEGP